MCQLKERQRRKGQSNQSCRQWRHWDPISVASSAIRIVTPTRKQQMAVRKLPMPTAPGIRLMRLLLLRHLLLYIPQSGQNVNGESTAKTAGTTSPMANTSTEANALTSETTEPVGPAVLSKKDPTPIPDAGTSTSPEGNARSALEGSPSSNSIPQPWQNVNLS